MRRIYFLAPSVASAKAIVNDLLLARIEERHIPVLFASNYFSRNQIQQVAEKTGARAVIVPENTNGAPGIQTYFDLMNTWVNGLAAAFQAGAS